MPPRGVPGPFLSRWCWAVCPVQSLPSPSNPVPTCRDPSGRWRHSPVGPWYSIVENRAGARPYPIPFSPILELLPYVRCVAQEPSPMCSTRAPRPMALLFHPSVRRAGAPLIPARRSPSSSGNSRTPPRESRPRAAAHQWRLVRGAVRALQHHGIKKKQESGLSSTSESI